MDSGWWQINLASMKLKRAVTVVAARFVLVLVGNPNQKEGFEAC